MKFWPLTSLIENPYMPPHLAEEWRTFSATLKLPSRHAYNACFDTAERVHPVEAPNLVVINNLGTPNRRLYLDYPGLDEWLRLERVVVMDYDGDRFVMLDALH